MASARAAVAAVVATIASLAVSPAATGGTGSAGDQLTRADSFALALGSASQHVARLDRLAAYDIVVLDGEGAPDELIAGLRQRGVLVLGYLSIGTIERGRGWTRDLRPYRLDHWDDWDEWFADVSDPGFQSAVTGTILPMILSRGFDGVFLDNVDMISSHRRQRDGMVTLVRDIAGIVHAQGGVVFAQNGEDIIDPFIPMLDGWNREDVTGTYDFDTGSYVAQSSRDVRAAQDALERLAAAGLVATATDYFAKGDDAGAARATTNACAVGALSFVSDIELNRLPADPPRCGT